MSELLFHLDSFDGPLDLLLKLITKNKVDILDIPISLILDQFMVYVEEMKKLDLDTAGEFAAMASELMLIKSRMLLPKPQSEAADEDPRADLAAALIEYKRMKEAAALISVRYGKYSGRLPKDSESIAPDETLYDQPPELLIKAFRKIAARTRESENEAIKTTQTLGSVITTQPVSIPGKIIGIMRTLYRRVQGVSIDELFRSAHSRSELVAIFMAILELMRVRRILLFIDGVEYGTQPRDDGEEDAEEAQLTFRLRFEH